MHESCGGSSNKVEQDPQAWLGYGPPQSGHGTSPIPRQTVQGLGRVLSTPHRARLNLNEERLIAD